VAYQIPDNRICTIGDGSSQPAPAGSALVRPRRTLRRL